MTAPQRPESSRRAPVAEIRRVANIVETWEALGGPKLIRNRGRAFWRHGDGLSISIDPRKNLWYDFVAGEGGDVVDLVRTVRQCGFGEAIAWLAKFAGMPAESRDGRQDADSDWPADRRWAGWWSATVALLAEAALAELSPCHGDRRELTELLAALRAGDGVMVDTYRAWRRGDPQLTSAMCWAGRRSDARMQRRLAEWWRRYCDAQTTA